MLTSATPATDDLVRRPGDHTVRPAVLGLGYVGLLLAVELASAGLDVISIDPEPVTVARLRGDHDAARRFDCTGIAERSSPVAATRHALNGHTGKHISRL